MTWALEIAMRRGEITVVRWEHLDRKTRALLLPNQRRDTSAHTACSLRHAVLGAFPGAPMEKCGKSVVYVPTRSPRPLRGFVGRPVLRGPPFDLPHEATSRPFEKRWSPMDVAAITGHKTLQMLERCTHVKANNWVEMLG